MDENGQVNPHPIEDPERVDERRRSVGLGTLAERMREMREEAQREGHRPPKDRGAFERSYQAWLREVGWRD